jgi:hypothetical protein
MRSQSQSPSDLANGELQLYLPEEESVLRYRREVSEDGEIFVSVIYPYCNHNLLPGFQTAEIRIATNADLLMLATSGAPMQ